MQWVVQVDSLQAVRCGLTLSAQQISHKHYEMFLFHIGVGPQRFAAIAERVLTPKVAPVVSVEHLHLALVSVAEESRVVVEALRRSKSLSFRNLVSDAENTMVIVARFLALLDLYRQGVLRFDQVIALGELQISWTGSESGEVEVTDEFDIPVVLEDDEPTEGSTNV